MTRVLIAAGGALLASCSGQQQPRTPTVASVTPRPAPSPERPSTPAPSSDDSFETCAKSYTTTIQVGDADMFWWCQNGVIGHRALATGVQETVTQLAGGGWLALDGDQLYISHAVATGKANLFRVPRTGGSIAKIGPVPPGPILPDGNYVWIGVESDGVQSFTGGLYRVATSGGATQLVGAPGNVVAVTKAGSTILFLQRDAAEDGPAHLWRADPASLATKHITPVGHRYELHAGGGFAFIDGLRIELNTGKWSPAPAVPIAMTDTKMLVRCEKTVCVAALGSTTFTPVPGVPATWQPMFVGPRHICWVTGKLGDKVKCVPH